jgi:excinuclease ABC subunit C
MYLQRNYAYKKYTSQITAYGYTTEMSIKDLEKYHIPDVPGVYFFVRKEEEKEEIIYIGKATSLHDRVRSYFTSGLEAGRGSRITQMVALANVLRFQTTDSVLEALILESNLIKKYQPQYNAREKDQKSYYCVVITKEEFPRVLLLRGRNIPEDRGEQNKKFLYIFGPYPYPTELRTALKIIRKIFPFRDACAPLSGRPCFNRQIGLCPGVCTGEVKKDEYRREIKRLALFFSGKKKSLLSRITLNMEQAAKKLHFEEAARLKRERFALEHIEDVALIKDRKKSIGENLRIEAYDIAHISGTNTVGAMTVVVGGEAQKNEYKKFKIKRQEKNDDVGNLREVLERRFSHLEWLLPDLIVIDGSLGQVNVAKKILEINKLKIPVVGVVKDERHRPKKIIGDMALARNYEQVIILANSEAHRFATNYHRKLRGKL